MNKGDTSNVVNHAARVLVVVDIHSQLLTSLEVAVVMANARHAGLHGMCVEDPSLQQVAMLPFSQEVMLLGGRTRTLEDQQLRRSMRSFKDRFKLLLAERAERHSLPWSLTTVSGQQQALEQGDRTPSDLVILGKPGQALPSQLHPARILVLAEHDELVMPTLEVLLKHNARRGVEVLLLGADTELARATHLADQLGNTANATVRLVSMQQASRLCAASSPALEYVLAANDTDKSVLAQVVQWASCPVLLVG